MNVNDATAADACRIRPTSIFSSRQGKWPNLRPLLTVVTFGTNSQKMIVTGAAH